MKAEHGGSSTTTSSIPAPALFNAAGPHPSSRRGCLGTLDGPCIEKLLLHCASALEASDVTLAQQVMWVLNNAASPSGDPNQRLAYWFLRALISRASRLCPTASAPMTFHGPSPAAVRTGRAMSVTDLAVYVDLMPWHRFGFCAANCSILRAVEGCRRVHILDFSVTHCMQWPTLIDELAKRGEAAPAVRISVPRTRPPVAPYLNVSIDEVGQRLANFAKSKGVAFEFHVIRGDGGVGAGGLVDDPSLVDLDDEEALVVNCQNWLRYLPPSERDRFLDTIRELRPRLVTVIDEDTDLDHPTLSARLTACFDYVWILFDALETFLPKDSAQRMEYEADVGLKIENVVGLDGERRIERPEPGARLAQRMRRGGFDAVPFCERSVREVKAVLDEHASGWGMRWEEGTMVLTWKGHSSVFATAWVPNGSMAASSS